MVAVIRRALANVSPEELLLIPVALLVLLGVILQPTAITRLFETPYATPIPGDSPADEVLNDRTPSPAPSPAGVEVQMTAGPTVIRSRPLIVQQPGRTFEAVRRVYIPAPVLSGR